MAIVALLALAGCQQESQAAPEGPKLTFTIPRSTSLSGSWEAYRFAGYIDDPATTATLTLNGEPLKIYSTGAFAGLFRLKPGSNRFEFIARRIGRRLDAPLFVFGDILADWRCLGAARGSGPRSLLGDGRIKRLLPGGRGGLGRFVQFAGSRRANIRIPSGRNQAGHL